MKKRLTLEINPLVFADMNNGMPKDSASGGWGRPDF